MEIKEVRDWLVKHADGYIDEDRLNFIVNILENYRMLELGNRQLLEELKLILNERNKYLDTIKWIKKQYDTDFTEEELIRLEPRDKVIYETTNGIVREIIKD